MTLSEAVQQGLMVTGVGLIIVFAVLIILMVTMIAMKKVFYKEEVKKDKANVNANANEVKPSAAVQNRQFAKEVKDENTLIAIFASAIAASLNTQVSSIKVHSYRCINDNASSGK